MSNNQTDCIIYDQSLPPNIKCKTLINRESSTPCDCLNYLKVCVKQTWVINTILNGIQKWIPEIIEIVDRFILFFAKLVTQIDITDFDIFYQQIGQYNLFYLLSIVFTENDQEFGLTKNPPTSTNIFYNISKKSKIISDTFKFYFKDTNYCIGMLFTHLRYLLLTNNHGILDRLKKYVQSSPERKNILSHIDEDIGLTPIVYSLWCGNAEACYILLYLKEKEMVSYDLFKGWFQTIDIQQKKQEINQKFIDDENLSDLRETDLQNYFEAYVRTTFDIDTILKTDDSMAVHTKAPLIYKDNDDEHGYDTEEEYNDDGHDTADDEDDEEGYYTADDEEDNHKPRVDISTPKTSSTITFHIWQSAFNCNELEKQKKTFRRLFGSTSNNTGLTIQGVFAALWQSQNIVQQSIQKIYIPNLFQCLATTILLHGPLTDKLEFIIFDTRQNIGNTIDRYFLQFIRFLVILHKKMEGAIGKMRDDLSKMQTLKSGFVLNIREEKEKKIEGVEILFERLTNIIDKLNTDGSDFITIKGGIQLPILLSDPKNTPGFEQYIQDELDHFLFMLEKRPMIERVETASPFGNSLIRNNYKSPINPDVFSNKNIQTLEQFVKIIHSRNADGYSSESDISVILPSELIKHFFGNKSKTDQESVEGFILTTQRDNMEHNVKHNENREKWYKYTNLEMIPGIPRLNFENTITDCEIGCGYANQYRCTQKIQKAKHISDPFTRGERYGIFPKKYRNYTRKVPNERGSFFPRINLFGPTYNRRQTQTQRQNGGKRSKNMRRRTHKRRNIT